MKDITANESLSIPEGVDIKIKSRIVTVTGPRGTLTKAVRHIQMDIQIVRCSGNEQEEQQVGPRKNDNRSRTSRKSRGSTVDGQKAQDRQERKRE